MEAVTEWPDTGFDEPPYVNCHVMGPNGRVLGEHNRCHVFLPEPRDVLIIIMSSGAEFSYVINNIGCWRTYPLTDGT